MATVTNKDSQRREFIKRGGQTLVATSLLGLGACSSDAKKDIHINFNQRYRWKMTTTWPPNFPILGEGCRQFAEWIRKMSGGRLDITVYGGGELIPALEGFDAVSNGAIEMNHGAAYYWSGKVPAAQFFAAVPFGMNAQQMVSWILAGGGLQLWEELYAPLGMVPFLAGNTGSQTGGWFNKEIRSLADLKGLKMRIPGLGGKVFAKVGGTPMLVSGGEIYTNLERGVMDASEWVGPFHDYTMGFHQIAPYYYYPGWQEPGAALELLVNKRKLEELPEDLQEILRAACYRLNNWIVAEFDAKNAEYLEKIRNESDVQILAFPDEVLNGLRNATAEVLQELSAADASVRKVYEHYQQFRATLKPWMDISEKMVYEKLS